jgi:thiol-disulfide isomerase/thioredoxin
MTGLLAVLGTLAIAGVLAVLLRAREGRIRVNPRATVRVGRTTGDGRSAAVVDEPAVEVTLPEPIRAALDPAAAVTLVQLSTTFCAPCRHTKVLLADLAARTDGVTHVELDVTDQPRVATTLGIYRTPTTVAYDPNGAELLRIGGVPRRESLLAALRPHL